MAEPYIVDLRFEKHTLDTLLKDVPKADRAAAALEVLDRYRKIKQTVWDLNVLIETEEKAFRERLRQIHVEISAVRKTCDHPETHYEPDPSGNNDSTTTCMVCGKEGRRL
jgi:hypothetical protein